MTCLYRGLRLTLVALLAYGLSFVLIGARVARAEMVSTETVLADAHGDAGARDRVRALLVREDVARELRDHGISRDQAEARVEALSDAELAEIAAG